MSGVTFNLYLTGKEALITDNPGQISWANDTIVAVLLKPGYVFNQNHSTWADISAYQITDPDYAPVVVTGKTSTLVTTKVRWGCNTISFGNPVTISAKTIVLLKRAGASLAASDQLICAGDLNDANSSAVVSSTSDVFQVTVGNGLFDI